jgi:zinc protease
MKKGRECSGFGRILFSILPLLFLLSAPLTSQERFRRSPPLPEPFPELSLPSIETHTLTNGLDIAIVRREDRPVISMRLIILTGERSSPDNLPGLATLTAKMLTKGTSKLKAADIEETIESIGGHMSVDTYPDYSMFSFFFLAEYLDEALSLLGEIILHPSFPRTEVENVQRSMFYDLAVRSTDPEFLARRLMLQILFESHPYKKIVFDQGEIKNMNRRDVFSFYSKYYVPNNAKLILAGNINLDTASKKVSRFLSPWQKKELERSYVPLLNPSQKMKIGFIDLPQAKDATIYLGNIIFPITSPDYFPFVVLNQMIGGTPTSRLFMHLRETKGYAYYAFSETQFYRGCGVFLVMSRVRQEVTYEAIREILTELDNIGKGNIPGQEIEQAKSYLVGHFPLTIETFEHLSSKVAEIQAFDLGRDHWERFLENIMRINSEMVSNMGQKYSLNTPVIVIVGNIEIVEYLKEFDQVTVYSIDGKPRYEINKEKENETG